MEFLMQAFLRSLKRYQFLDYSYSKEKNGSYLFIFQSLPPEVDVKIVNKKISIHVMNDENGDPIIENMSICTPIEKGPKRSIKVIFDEMTYAKKINFLDVVFRDYCEKHNWDD